MAFDELGPPLGIKQIGVALGGVVARNLACVVADNLQPSAHSRVHPIRVDVFLWEILGDILGNIGRDPVVALPVDEMRRVRAADNIYRKNAACLFLSYTLKNPLGSRTLDAYRDARIFRFEYFAKSFCNRELQRGVEGNLSFLPRRRDQIRCDRARLRRRGFERLREESAGRQSRRRFEHFAPR